ncbi:hypothetical protein MYP_272 [Sporocytophaga myxococcoides]|uniref:Uncharacterized protein n=1 Tax=Sporocytophaga myxococcoides TaxID=153721 RepID=A0A098L8H5_9BACT|nr:hypothetical protein MYP_272 [Sporocytophaga myxococcoides]
MVNFLKEVDFDFRKRKIAKPDRIKVIRRITCMAFSSKNETGKRFRSVIILG